MENYLQALRFYAGTKRGYALHGATVDQVRAADRAEEVAFNALPEGEAKEAIAMLRDAYKDRRPSECI